MVEGASARGTVAHLLPNTYKRLVSEWLEEDTPSFDYGGFVVGEEMSEAKLLGKSEVLRKLLLGERVALNTLARCSGIATKSARLIALLRKAGYKNILAGTRKTTPGFRLVEKYGMLVGGVDPHRVDLSAMTMLKDNHIVAAGSITNAVRAAKAAGGFAIKVEVECQSFEEADEAIAAGADIVMLDNFTPDGVKVAATQLKDKWGRETGDRKAFLVEVSGGLTEDNIEKHVCQDVDILSTSSIHQGVPHVDFSLKIVPKGKETKKDRSSNSSSALSFTISSDRLIELYYENFYPSSPLTLPIHFLRERTRHQNHQMENLLLVIKWIGSIYAPWTPSEAFYQQAYQALLAPTLPKNGFSVQALLLFSIAQHHSDFRPEARKMLDAAITLGLELSMNTREFIRQQGEMNPILEESWRRTFYFLLLTDQHYSVTTSNPFYRMQGVPNQVDLPCDNEFYEAGQIPLPASLEEYDRRDFVEVEVVYSSLTYLYDISRVVEYIMRTFVETGSFNEDLISTVEAKVAVWKSLLPICKKDPLRQDGTIDEIMYLAHLLSAIVLMNTHRPLSSLNYTVEELSVSSFSAPALFIDPPRPGRTGHTARALKAAEIQTKLLAIPCPIQKHHPFTMCISASLAAAQIAACNTLLEDRALSIARDRVRLSIGTLNAMAGIWPLAKNMAKDVRYIARMTLASATSSRTIQFEPAQDEIETPREDIIWPLNPSADIDIYSGIVLPMDLDMALYHPSLSSLLP
ncbi:Quinolinate phosphoribosyl transferase [Clohesyomyces aquaticus]|uniref:Nicotinate-nucleotide pyrophosphorylase [carboxylating] n=1 Tax=Clohesyomyces aquaticus TaxID=1231657 RepID=A0A1Y2A053_9PLEO|nr:Quinolinate phosphoribosyl transferase [Clohesyomyces aquaticus]